MPLQAVAATEPPVSNTEFLARAHARCAGDPRAIGELGARLLVGRDAPYAPADGMALLADAMQQNVPEAWCHLAVLAATGAFRDQSWRDALTALETAATLGLKRAVRQRQLLSALGISQEAAIHAWLETPNTRVLHSAPRFAAHGALLPLAMCKYVIEQARPRLQRAQVVDAHTGTLKTDPMRTNTNAAFSLIDTDVILQLARARIARAAGVNVNALEPMEVLHYAGGETYKPHIDFFHPSRPGYTDQMRLRGQRVKTSLVYLNAGYEGGETEFPKLGIKFRGDVGEALVFDNVGTDGEGDMNTLHTGLPTTSGEKWLLSQWIREKPQPIV